MRTLLSLAALSLAASGCPDHPSPGTATPGTTTSPHAYVGPPIRASFPARGVDRLVLRAGSREEPKIEVEPGASEIVVSGRPVLSGLYEPSSDFGDVGFVFEPFDRTLVASTKGEYVYIHFGVIVEELTLTVPQGVKVERERLTISEEKGPDLRAPGSPPRPAVGR